MKKIQNKLHHNVILIFKNVLHSFRKIIVHNILEFL
jgi:hypothetical protein